MPHKGTGEDEGEFDGLSRQEEDVEKTSVAGQHAHALLSLKCGLTLVQRGLMNSQSP